MRKYNRREFRSVIRSLDFGGVITILGDLKRERPNWRSISLVYHVSERPYQNGDP